MASHTQRISLGVQNEQIQLLQVSQDGTANTALNPITVPTGKVWIIKQAVVVQSDATARAVAIQVTDGTNIVATIAGDIVTTLATSKAQIFSGHLILAAGMQIQGNTVGITASTPTLQLLGLEFNAGLPTSVLTLA